MDGMMKQKTKKRGKKAALEPRKQKRKQRTPNLQDYEQFRRSFRWEDAAAELSGLPGNKGLNIGYEAVDRHAESHLKESLAIRWIGEDGKRKEFTYQQLSEQTNRFANLLRSAGIRKGDVVCTLTGRIPELYFSALGTLKNGSIYCPLFSIYGPEPIYQRLHKGKAKVLVTSSELYKKKVTPILDRLVHLKLILLTDGLTGVDQNHVVIKCFSRLMSEASESFEVVETDAEDQALLHFTSGTTGMPKGVVHVHQAAVTHYMTGKYVLDFQPGDLFWCTADPGWVTGTSYGILSPLMHGIGNLIVEADFDASLWYGILEKEKVNIWYTAPTAIRRLMRINIDVRKEYDLSELRLIHSVGEPLNPEAIRWSEKNLGMPILDNWWQTETGGIMIANYPGLPVKPGSMGKPLPGIEAAVMEVSRPEGKGIRVKPVKTPGESGELALKSGWPSMFRAYLDDEERYKNSFAGEWYMTGDLAYRDDEGYYWFVGRADDIIKTAGHMVGPFEVESALLEHPNVAEAAVIGKPDPMMGELVKAFVVLREKAGENEEELLMDLKGFARKKLGSAVAPREYEVVEELPKTRSGKIMRRCLRDIEMGKLKTKKKVDGEIPYG